MDFTLVIGPTMMDPPLPEPGGSKVTALGSEPLPLMNQMKLSSMITAIMKNILAQISMTDKSTQVDILVSGTGKLGESVTT